MADDRCFALESKKLKLILFYVLGSDADGKGLLAFHMIPQPEHSVANLDKFLAQASKISPELDNESLRNSLAGLAQDISCLSSLNALQSSSTFLQELGLNSGKFM